MRAKEDMSKWRKKALDVFEKNKEIASEKWAKISERLGFWRWTAVLSLGSPILAFIIYQILDQLVSANYNCGIIWASSEDARYILSALSQAQAAIFGIFFTLNFIIFQTQVGNVSPASIKRSLHSPKLIFIFIIFITSISADLILLKYIPYTNTFEIDIFWPISLSIFGVLILILYMRMTLMDLVKDSIIEEIRNGRARYNLNGADLSGANLKYTNLESKNLSKCNLIGTNLYGANLVASNLNRADLRNACLSDAQLTGANLSFANLNRAELLGAELIRSNLSGANITEADLTWSNLYRANLIGANLNGVSLYKTNLNETFLIGTNLIGADLREADIKGAYFGPIFDFDGQIIDEKNLRDIACQIGDGAHVTEVLVRLADIKYDDKTLENLLKAKNLDKAILKDNLRMDLIKKANILIARSELDLEFRKSLIAFLDSQKDLRSK